MNGIKISDLELVTSISKTDVLPIVNSDNTKKVSIEQLINSVKSEITILSIELVTSTTDIIKENVLYLVPASEDEGNMYNEYMLINNNIEQVGSQSIDLTGYAKTTEVEQMINTAITGALEGSY